MWKPTKPKINKPCLLLTADKMIDGDYKYLISYYEVDWYEDTNTLMATDIETFHFKKPSEIQADLYKVIQLP